MRIWVRKGIKTTYVSFVDLIRIPTGDGRNQYQPRLRIFHTLNCIKNFDSAFVVNILSSFISALSAAASRKVDDIRFEVVKVCRKFGSGVILEGEDLGR